MKKYRIPFLVFIFLLAGCSNDWLELENPNLQTTETFWKTDDDFKRGVNATYQSLAIYDGTYMRFAPFALNLKSDDIWSPSPWQVLSLVGNFNVSYGDPIMQQFLWTAFYGVVNRANQVLVNIEPVEFVNAGKKDQYKGEALFLRALAYFHLVNFYRNIPLVLHPYESDEDFFPNQEKPEVIWQQIYADFEEASKLLPEKYPADETGRATKGAALAFLGKACLFNKDYEKAAANFKAVIDLGIYGLMDDYEANFTEAFENNKESIFEIQFDRNVGGTTLGWVSAPGADWSLTSAHAITFAPTGFGFGDAAATKWIFDEFLIEKTVEGEVDPRIRASISYDYEGCMMYGKPFRQAFNSTRWNEFFVRKYTNAFNSSRVDEYDWRSGINERLMRYSDVLLMYAECLYEKGDPGQAATYISQVRNRAKLPDKTNAIAALDPDAFYSQLSHERALELCFEGIRFGDLVRWGWFYDAGRLAELKTHDLEFDNYVPNREYFPIAQGELDRNPNYVQNPGW